MRRHIVQRGRPGDYLATLSTDLSRLFRQRAEPREPAARPGHPLAIHRLRDAPAVEHFSWGCTPNRGRHRPTADARLDMLLRDPAAWWPLLSQRVLVPADGWYEPGESGRRVPRYFRRRDGRPFYIAGIAAWRPGWRALPDGLAILTDRGAKARPDAAHLPIVLPARAALAWIDPATPVIDALRLACMPWRDDGAP